MTFLTQINNKSEIQKVNLEKSDSTDRELTLYTEFNNRINNIYNKKKSHFQQDKNYQRIGSQTYISPKLPKTTPQNNIKKSDYTLVLDIDETLVHTKFTDQQNQYEVLIRPYAFEFLKIMSTFFEIITFTAGTKEYADEIIDKHIDPENKYISQRLYRENCKWFKDVSQNNEEFTIKDLSQLGRNLKTTLILDNLGDNFNFLQPLNGIEVKSYFGGYDQQLKDLIDPLIYLVTQKLDVRSFIYSHIKEFLLENIQEIEKLYSQYTNSPLKRKSQKASKSKGQGQVLLKRRKSKQQDNYSDEILKKIILIFIFIGVRMSYCTIFAFHKFCYYIHKVIDHNDIHLLQIQSSFQQQQIKIKQSESSFHHRENSIISAQTS